MQITQKQIRFLILGERNFMFTSWEVSGYFSVSAQHTLSQCIAHISSFPRIPPSFSERGPRAQRPQNMRLLILMRSETSYHLDLIWKKDFKNVPYEKNNISYHYDYKIYNHFIQDILRYYRFHKWVIKDNMYAQTVQTYNQWNQWFEMH